MKCCCKSQVLVIFAVFATIASAIGCNKIAATHLGKSEAETTDHEHFPLHWPNNIVKATDRLVAMKTQGIGIPKFAEVSPEAELLDLVRWLPMLAADSDLKEPDFNQIDQWSAKYVPVIEDQVRKGTSLSEIISVEGIQNGIRELETIVIPEKERLLRLEGHEESTIVKEKKDEAN